jgi:hypothetical protein
LSLTPFYTLLYYFYKMEENDTSSKKMIITGKNNIYKIKEVVNGGIKPPKEVRTIMKDVEETLFLKQVQLINRMYMHNDDDTKKEDVLEDNEKSKLLKHELEKKINGYKQQDIKKGIYDIKQLITFEEVVEKLVISKLKCAYCSCTLLLLYKNVREPSQWTLDRKYNDECHSNENTQIACLKCNLERRVKNVDKFTFTKKLRINKEM